MLRTQLGSLQRLREDSAARNAEVTALQAEAAELRASRDDAANLRQQVALLEERVASRDGELHRKEAELAGVRRGHAGSELELRGQVAAAEAALHEGAAAMSLLHGEAQADVAARLAVGGEEAAAREALEFALRQEAADARAEIARLQGAVAALEGARDAASAGALQSARDEAELSRLREQVEPQYHTLRGVQQEMARELAAAHEARAAGEGSLSRLEVEAAAMREELAGCRRRQEEAALAAVDAERTSARLDAALQAQHGAEAKVTALERESRERGREGAAATAATADLRRELETLAGLVHASISTVRASASGDGGGGNGHGSAAASASALSWRLQEASERSSSAHRNWEGMLASLVSAPALAPLADALVDLRGGALGALRLLHEAHVASARLGAAGRQSDAALGEYQRTMATLEAEALAALLSETSAAQHELDGATAQLAKSSSAGGGGGARASPSAVLSAPQRRGQQPQQQQQQQPQQQEGGGEQGGVSPSGSRLPYSPAGSSGIWRGGSPVSYCPPPLNMTGQYSAAFSGSV